MVLNLTHQLFSNLSFFSPAVRRNLAIRHPQYTAPRMVLNLTHQLFSNLLFFLRCEEILLKRATVGPIVVKYLIPSNYSHTLMADAWRPVSLSGPALYRATRGWGMQMICIFLDCIQIRSDLKEFLSVTDLYSKNIDIHYNLIRQKLILSISDSVFEQKYKNKYDINNIYPYLTCLHL